MSELIVIAFDDEHKAKEVRDSLSGMHEEHLVDVEDAAVVIKKTDGRMRLDQTHNLPLAGTVSGTFWGLLVGMLFSAPLIGAAVGAGAGAISGALADIGIDGDFMEGMGGSLPPGSSALFVLVRSTTPHEITEELRPFGGRVLRTSLSTSDEEKLRQVLRAAREKPSTTTSSMPASVPSTETPLAIS